MSGDESGDSPDRRGAVHRGIAPAAVDVDVDEAGENRRGAEIDRPSVGEMRHCGPGSNRDDTAASDGDRGVAKLLVRGVDPGRVKE